MITEKELLKAIDECQREPITGSKRGTLADLFIIYDHLFGEPFNSGYSYANEVENLTIKTTSDTEFLAAVNGKDTEKVLVVIDELMQTIQVLHPRIYDAVIDKLNN